MDSDMIMLELTDKMDKAIESLEKRFATVRAGRANPSSLDGIMVEYYGSMTPLNQVASISVPEARQIMIAPWDKSLIGPIMKAIQVAELGINPMNDGNGIRLTFPELNEERRREIVKSVKALGEDTKVGIRNARRDAIDEAKKSQKAGEISEDELRGIEEKIQKITDKYVSKAEELVVNKEKEVMEV